MIISNNFRGKLALLRDISANTPEETHAIYNFMAMVDYRISS